MSQDNGWQGPTRDTSPIPFEQLLADQETVIQGVNDLLRSMHQDAQRSRPPTSSPPPAYPWPPIFENRTNRNIVIDGQRGTGKTALLLTLLLGWQRDARAAKDRGDVERRLFDGMGKLVRPLRLLDFNPLPEHLHPYTLFVQAFKPLVDALASAHPRPNRVWVSHENEPIDVQWKRLHRSAELGWQPARERSRDIEQRGEDSLVQDTEWLELGDEWTTFVDRLIEILEERGLIERGALLVLPVDDLDLHPTLSDDLLLALRKTPHPRVAVLLTGHVVHLEESVSLKMMVRTLGPSHGILAPSSEQVLRVQRLASDLVQKVLPPRERVAVPLLSLTEAWRIVTGEKNPTARLREHQESASRLNDGAAPEIRGDIADFLEYQLSIDLENVVRVRDAVQNAAINDLIKGLLRTLELCRDPSGAYRLLSTPNGQWRWSSLEPRATLHIWTYYGGYTSTIDMDSDTSAHYVHHTTSEDNGSLAARIVFHHAEPSYDDDMSVIEQRSPIQHSVYISRLSQAARVLELLLFLKDHRRVQSVIREDSECSFAEHMTYRLRSNLELDLPFPIPVTLHTGRQHWALAHKWNASIPTSAKGEPDATLWLWIWHFLGEPLAEIGVEDRDEFLAHLHLDEGRWARLLTLLANRSSSPPGHELHGFERWARLKIPVMAAPEYGLSFETQRRLIGWLRSNTPAPSWPAVCRDLDRERSRALLRSALLFSSFTDDQLEKIAGGRDTSTYDGVFSLIEEEIKRDHPDAPWLTKDRPQGRIININTLVTSYNQRAIDALCNVKVAIPNTKDRFHLGRLLQAYLPYNQDTTNWAGNQLENSLIDIKVRQGFLTRVEELTSGIISAADFMVAIWRLLTENARLETTGIISWIRSEDSHALTYEGPAIQVSSSMHEIAEIYRLETRTHSSWKFEVEHPRLELSDSSHHSLLAWLLLCQSYPTKTSGFENIEIQPTPLLAFKQEQLFGPEINTWHTQESIRQAWCIVCDIAMQRHGSTPYGQQRPQEEWILANWIVMHWNALTTGEPRTILTYPLRHDEFKSEIRSRDTFDGTEQHITAIKWLQSIDTTREVFGSDTQATWNKIIDDNSLRLRREGTEKS